MSKDRFFIAAYLLIALVILSADAAGYSGTRYFFKPLIMIGLLLWSFFTPDKREVSKKQVFGLGMVFACAGDIFLMWKGYFLHGLGAFLVMQVLYIAVFSKEITRPLRPASALVKGGAVLLALAFILAAVMGGLTEPALKIAVPVYAFTISLMTFSASLRDLRVSRASYFWVLAGAVCFMISDTLIAFNSFVSPVPNQHFWIMSTYMAAQFSIVKGLLKTR